MVVQRKQPAAPMPVASRHNSAHAVPRANKAPKSSSLAQTPKGTPQPQPPQPAQNGTPLTTSHPKSKHKKSHPKKTPKHSRSILDKLVLFALGFFVYYAATTCPADTFLTNPICRSLSQYRTHVLEPYILPHVHRALSHPNVAPYIIQAERIERDSIRPVVEKTIQISGPYAAAAKRVVWDQTTVPAFNAYVVPQYNQHILPPWNKHVAPHIVRAKPYVVQAEKALRTSASASRKFYMTKARPAAVHAYEAGKPYAVQTYVTVRPHVIAAYSALAAHAGEARRAYVDPHVVRIWEKVLELSGAGPVGTPVDPAAKPAANDAVKTSKAEPVEQESTVEVVTPKETPSSSEAAPVVATTPVVDATTASEPEKETVAAVEPEPETKSASVSASETASVPEDVAAAASVAAESAHGMESPVLEEIKSAAATAAADDEEDLTDFLSQFGADPEAPVETWETDDEDVELTPDEIAALKAEQDEEQRVALIRQTAEKRADLEGRMEKSRVKLVKLAKDSNETLRKVLVRLRKVAAAKLEDESKGVGKAVPDFEKEAEKMLKGLDAYLRKELKSEGGKLMERENKWNAVVDKVEEKLSEKIQATQAALQQILVDLRAQEVEEGMAIIEDLKSECSQAQADVGMELAWLDDVTHLDWKVYHNLADIGANFQAEASEIQAGTHAHPPADPFQKKLEETQAKLSALVSSIADRLTALRVEAENAFSKAALPVPVPSQEQEPEVSILPIKDASPPPADGGAFEAGKVVIGKSQEQVEAALKQAEAAAPVHEEL